MSGARSKWTRIASPTPTPRSSATARWMTAVLPRGDPGGHAARAGPSGHRSRNSAVIPTTCTCPARRPESAAVAAPGRTMAPTDRRMPGARPRAAASSPRKKVEARTATSIPPRRSSTRATRLPRMESPTSRAPTTTAVAVAEARSTAAYERQWYVAPRRDSPTRENLVGSLMPDPPHRAGAPASGRIPRVDRRRARRADGIARPAPGSGSPRRGCS